MQACIANLWNDDRVLRVTADKDARGRKEKRQRHFESLFFPFRAFRWISTFQLRGVQLRSGREEARDIA